VVSEKSPAIVAIRSVEGPNGPQTSVRGTPRRAPDGRRWAGLDDGKKCRHQNGYVRLTLAPRALGTRNIGQCDAQASCASENYALSQALRPVILTPLSSR
jgi:hypothetical protein